MGVSKTMIAVLAVVVIVVVAGAAAFVLMSNNDKDSKDSGPVTLIDGEGRSVTITSSDRIASVNLSMTEMICAMGGIDKLAGVTVDAGGYSSADYIVGMTDDGFPQAVLDGIDKKTIKNLGGMWQISAESILESNPDLVIMGGGTANSEATKQQLDNFGIPYVICKDNSSYTNFYYNIELIGKAIGKESESKVVVDQMKASIKKISDWANSFDETPRVGMFISFAETGGAWATGNAFFKGTEFIELFGGVNAFDIEGMYQLTSFEGIVTVDPDIMITGTFYAPPIDLKTHPILGKLKSIKDDRAYSFGGSSNSAWNSTSIEFVNSVALVAMFLYEDHLDFEIPHTMDDDYIDYIELFWAQINA